MRRSSFQQILAFVLLLIALTIILVSVIDLVSNDKWVDVYIYILVVAVILAGIGFRILLIARRIHPCIKKYFVTSLDVAEVKQKVDNAEPFPIKLGEDRANLLVTSESLFEEGAEIIEIRENGEIDRRTIDENVTYLGRVVGAEETSDVRLTITHNILTGYVMHEKNWWFIEPLKKFRIDANISDYLVYRTRDLKFKLNLSNDIEPIEVEQFDPDSLPEGSAYLPGPPPSPPPPPGHKVGPSVGILLVADCEYAQQAQWTGAPWHQQQNAVLHTVNGLYKKNLGYWFTPKAWIMSKKALTNHNGSKLMGELKDVVKKIWGDLGYVKTRKAKGTEVAHLTTGKDLYGSLLGLAQTWIVKATKTPLGGVYSLSQQQLIWVGGGGGLFGGPPNLAFQNMMLMAHEIGHTFNAVHEEADKWCVTHFIGCLDYERSLMWATFYDDNNAWISNGSFNKNHDNKERIKKNMATGRNRNFI